eukprot:m51a1_g13251 hypothetical protein (150) ;mRNA; r:94-2239
MPPGALPKERGVPAVLFCLLFWPDDNHHCFEADLLLGIDHKANSANIALALAETACSGLRRCCPTFGPLSQPPRAHFRKERGVLACCNAAGMVISGLALPAVLFCLLFWPEDNHGCSEVVMFLGTANKANSANIALALLFTQKKTTGSL